MSHFAYHYAVFKSAGLGLSVDEGIDPKEFARLDAVREASRTAIALDAGIITKIPTDGRLTGLALTRTNALIKRHEISDQIQDELNPDWMYEALDKRLSA